MADKNIQMTQRNAANTAWDNLYPETGYVRSPAYGPAAGAVNAYTFAAMAAAALVDGMSVYLDNGIAANTGAATFNWSGLGAKAIVDSKGAALTAGKMPLDCIIGLRYNASTTSFQLLGEGGDTLTGNMVAGDLLAGKTGYSNNPATKITGTATIESLGGIAFASGSGTTDSNGSLIVSGLNFMPSIIVFYSLGVVSPNATYNVQCSTTQFAWGSGVAHNIAEFSGYLNSSGFNLHVLNYVVALVYWKAFK